MAEEYPSLPSTSRIRLEPLSLIHLQDFHELWTNEESVKFTTKIIMKNIDESREFMHKILPNKENPEIDKFAILLLPSSSANKVLLEKGLPILNEKGAPKCIGIVGTNRMSAEGMETGYCLNSLYWGQGFGTEAFSLFLNYYWTLPQRKHIPHLVAKTHPSNIASSRILEKCGGRKGENILRMRNPFLKKNGEVFEGEKEGKDEKEEKEFIVRCWFFDRPQEKQ